MKFKILIHKKADDFLKELRQEERQRITAKLKELEEFPTVKLDIVKIAGEAKPSDCEYETIEHYSKSMNKKK